MKRKICRTAGRRKMKIGIITSITLILCIFLGFGYLRYAEGYRLFRAPERDPGAAAGTAENTLGFEMLPVREGYTVGIDTTPVYQDGRLYINAACPEDNTVWFMLRVYQEDTLIGQSGIFYPNEYVESVACSRELSAEDKVLIKVMAYEPETYHSEGAAQISVAVSAP